MRTMRAWLVRVAGLFHQARADRELDEELESHLQMHVDDNMRFGMTPVEARRQALISLGAIESLKESYRDRRGIPLVEHFVQDLRYGLRMLARTPGFTAITLLTLAVGTGANTALFGLWNQAVLEPLPVANPQDLVDVLLSAPSGARFSNLDYPEFRVFGDERRVFSNALLYARREVSLRWNGQWQRVNAQQVSGSFYSTLGVNAVLGRTIADADDRSAAPVAVLGYSFWTRTFGQDAGVLGKTVEIGRSAYTIVGVTPPGFFGLDRLHPPDITIPMAAAARPGTVWCVGRLRPGVSLDQARAALATPLVAALEQQKPRINTYSPSEREQILGMKVDVRRAGWGNWGLELMLADWVPLLAAAFGVLLLIGCVNVANLLLARASARYAEISTRLALGAGRWRIFRQLLTESLLLSTIGAALGLLVALGVHPLFVTLLPLAPQALVHFTLDVRILGFSAAAALLTGILFGTVPALRISAVDPYTVLKGATAGGGQRRLRPARTMLVFQVAASIVLLVAAALLVRTLRNLQTLDAGFDRDHMLVVTLGPGPSHVRGAEMVDLYDQLYERVRKIPGVRSAALAEVALFGAGSVQKTAWVGGYAYAPHEDQSVAFNEVGPGFFSTAGIPVLMGRDFRLQDRTGSAPVAIVNDAFVRKYFPGQNPLGRRFGDTGPSSIDKYEIIGVVRDAKYWTLREPPRPAVFQAFWQGNSGPPFVLHVRTRDAPAPMADQVRHVVRSIDSDLIVYDTRTMAEQVSETLRTQRAFALISTLIGAVALLLTCIGLYGVAGYSVTRRTREIGTRMALGACPGDILRMVLRETLIVAAIGLAIGIPVALAASRLLASRLFGLTSRDPGAIAVAAVLMTAVASVASYLPARRAARVVPMSALRYE